MKPARQLPLVQCVLQRMTLALLTATLVCGSLGQPAAAQQTGVRSAQSGAAGSAQSNTRQPRDFRGSPNGRSAFGVPEIDPGLAIGGLLLLTGGALILLERRRRPTP